MIPPHTTKASKPGSRNFSMPCEDYVKDRTKNMGGVPIQIGDIGGLGFFVSLTALSGFPLFAASCRAYRSFALRC